MENKNHTSNRYKSSTAAIAAVLLLISVLFAGCAKEAQPENHVTVATEETVETSAVQETNPVSNMKKVAMITDWGSAKNSYGNQACWQAIEKWCAENGVDCVCYESEEDTTDERVLRVVQAITEGADTVVLPGYLFGSVMVVVKDVYPDVKLLGIDVDAGDLTLDYETVYEPTENMTCLTFCEEQMGYLAGYAAVQEGYRKLGYQGGLDVPAVVRSGYGFVQGADAAAAELGVKVEINYAYSRQYFGNAALTSQLKQWYADGTEVIFTSGGAVYTSAIEAARESGGKVIGLEIDPAAIDDCVITSASKNLAAATSLALQAIWDSGWESFGGKAVRLSLTDGDSLGLLTDEASWRLENFTVEDYLAVKGKIADGTISVKNSDDPSVKPEVSEFTKVNYLQ